MTDTTDAEALLIVEMIECGHPVAPLVAFVCTPAAAS